MKKEKYHETLFILVLVLGIIWYNYRANYLLLAAGILCFTGAFIPSLAQLIHVGWMKLALFIGLIMGKVMLTIVYVLVLLPLSFFSRLVKNKNGVLLKRQQGSYFTERNFTYTKESVENVW